MDPISVNISELKTHISKYKKHLQSGRSIILTERNKPFAMITPTEDEESVVKARMSIRGALKGKMIVEDSFYDPMTEEELAQWYDNPIIPETAKTT